MRLRSLLILFGVWCGAGVRAAEGDGWRRAPVLVLEPPSHAFLTNTTGTTLRCAALGNPAPSLAWVDAAGRPLQPQPGLREVLSDGSLWLSPATRGSAHAPHASYRCKATNPSGTVISRLATVSTVVTAGVAARVEAWRATVGGVGVLRCVVDEGGWAVAAWLRRDPAAGTPLPLPDAGRYVYGSGGRLYVQDVTLEDGQAAFQCQVRHPASLAALTSSPATLTVMAPSARDGAPRMAEKLPRMVEVLEGKPWTLPCLAHGHPPPHYSWTREGVVGELGSVGGGSGGRVWVRGSVVGGSRAGAGDAGGYTCVAANGAGTDTAHYTLTVVQELHVTAHPSNQVAAAGGRATVACRVEGSPVAEVRWYKDGDAILPHAHGHIMLQGRDTLVLTGVGERDAGVYQCVAANSVGEAQAASHLTIRDSPPTLRHTFVEQTLRAGGSVSLKCTALGHPPPVITWSLDGRPLAPASDHYGGQRVSLGSWVDPAGQVVSQVNVSRVTHLDGGRYACTAANAAGSISHTSPLNVYGPPTARGSSNVTVVEGTEAKVSCPVAGYPLVGVTWALHGRPLTPTSRRAPRGDGTLVIQRVEADHDVGRYSCTANGPQGTDTASFFLSVVKPPVLAEIKFQEGLVEGMRLSVTCSLLSGDLPISLRWSRDGRPLPRDSSLTETHSQFFSNLVFAEIMGRHAGRYSCTASNAAASATVSATMHVQVPPAWVVEPQDVAVVGGGEASLECHAQGTPTPTLTWRKATAGYGSDEWSVVRGDGWRVRLRRPGSLSIRDARAEDAGRYLCQAENNVTPPISKTITLTVLEGARMEEKVINQSVAVGEHLSLRCPARGDLPLSFTWARDGVTLSGGGEEEVRLEEGGRTSVLVLPATLRSQAGVYTCHAANRYGSDSSTFFLNVVERPDPPSHVHVKEVKSREVSLAWAPPFDGNSPLTHYLLQHWAARDSAPAPANTTLPRDLTEATLKGLSPGRTYHMQVLAVNVRGASSPSPTLSITTLQEPPSAPPTHLRAHARQQASISLTWQTPAAHLSPGEVTGYQVGFRESSVAGDEGEYRWKSVRGGAMTAKVEGLRHYTAYSVTVRAVNQVGSGPHAQPVTVTTAQGVPSAAPDGIECDPLSSQALRVRWNPLPLNLSNGPVQGYKVFYKRTSNIEGSNAVDVKRTTNLETSLQGLGRYTNYSVRVLAYTGAGDGVVSGSIHCATLQDVPGPPAAIRALPAGPHSIVVSWLPPERPNGILEHYTLYYRPLNAHRALQTVVVPVEGGATANRPPWGEVSREVENLDAHARYEMWVKASTRVGEGGASRVVSQAPAATVAAKIKSFGQAVEVKAGAPLTLPCAVVGHSAPLVTWTHLGRDAIPNSQTLPDHSLHLPAVTSEASGNYTCHAHNPIGRDEAQWSVRVVETPPPPTLRVQYSTETTIHISWHTAGDGGKPITGYIIRYRLEGGEWLEEAVEPGEASHVLQKLRCGSTYHLQVAARNLVGHGKASRNVKTRTRGAAPRQPRHQDLVSVNSSSVTLQLYTWPSGGCPITRWMVEYRAHSDNDFTAAASHLAGDTDSYTLGDLAPLTWYQLRVTAYNTAGSTTAAYDVATASLTGATLAPESVVEVVDRRGSPLYLDPHILAPVVSGVACTLALLLCVGLLISRGRAQFMKGADTNGGSSGGGGGGNSNGNTYSRSLAEIQNHHNDSQEQLSPPPGPRSKHDEAYSEIACISSQQTLPISCVRGGVRRAGKKELEEEEEGEAHGGSESEQDTSGSPGGVRGGPRDTYKVPVRLRRGADFSFHPPDSSTESNDERSPVPPRRPQHLPPTHPQHASHRLHACTPAPPPAQGLRRPAFPPRPPTDYSIHV